MSWTIGQIVLQIRFKRQARVANLSRTISWTIWQIVLQSVAFRAIMMMEFVHKFDTIGAADADIFGESGANLGELKRAGLRVPPGFCLSAEAYRAFITGEYVDRTVRQILMGLQVNDPEDVEVRTEQVRNFLYAQPMPNQTPKAGSGAEGGFRGALIAQEVMQGYYELGVELGSGVAPARVAVRSSTTYCDRSGEPCSGQQETYLNVSGEANLIGQIKHCWGSLWTAQAVAQRVKQGIDHAEVGLAVIVQAMVQAEASGLLFLSPYTISGEQMVIVASWGLSEAIISGLVTPDTFTVRRSDGAVIERNIAPKDSMVECAIEGGTIEREVPAERRRIPAISDTQIAELVALSKRIETLCGAQLDIEWAYARGRVFICDVGVLAKGLHSFARALWELNSASGQLQEYNS